MFRKLTDCQRTLGFGASHCMLSTKNKHANWNFFPDFQLRKTTCILPFITPKTACYQPRISMQTVIFFPDFQLIKTAGISTIYHTKNYMLSTKNKHANWNFFSRFLTQKNNMHFYHLSHKKTACYQPRISMQTGFFFSRFPAQKNRMHFYHLSHKKLYVINQE